MLDVIFCASIEYQNVTRFEFQHLKINTRYQSNLPFPRGGSKRGRGAGKMGRLSTSFLAHARAFHPELCCAAKGEQHYPAQHLIAMSSEPSFL